MKTNKKVKKKKKIESSLLEEEILEKAGPDKKFDERVLNYKVSSEELREIEIKGISFLARFYKTTSKTSGIRIPLEENGPLFTKFLEYCKEIKEERIDKEKEKDLIAFTTFGKLDKGLEFFPIMGFYVYPFLNKKKDPYLIFNQEKNAPLPIERLGAFIDYYRKKFKIRVRLKKRSFDSLRALDLTEI